MENKQGNMFEDFDLDDIELGGISAVNTAPKNNLKNEATELTPEMPSLSKNGLLNGVPSLGDIFDKTPDNKKAASKKSEPKKTETKKAYTGPRIIKVYGDELWVEEDPNVTNEQIRQRIVDEFGYREFRKDKTIFDLDEDTGILVVDRDFKKKG